MAFGIDFGTTNSAVVYTTDSGVPVRITSGSNRPYPSLIAIHPDTGEVLGGEEVRKDRQTLEEYGYVIVSSVKRLLDTPRTWQIRGETWDSVKVASTLFEKLRELVISRDEIFATGPMNEAVISIPVGFTAQKRTLLRKAARDAGIAVTGFISEPTAAFLQYKAALSNCRLVAVFDWGGGTLDVSVLRIHGTRIEELATAGLSQAGDEIDERLAKEIHRREFPDIPYHNDLDGRDDLIFACEQAKIDLNPDHGTPPHDMALVLPRGYLGRNALRLTSTMLDDVVGPLIQRAEGVLDEAMRRAGVIPHDVDHLLLVGGSSNLVVLRKRLEERFPGKIPPKSDEQAWASAQGASLVARNRGCYRVMQRVCLVQGDPNHTQLDLIQHNDRVGGKPRFFSLGMTEDAPDAVLVFMEPGSESEDGPLRGIDGGHLVVPAGEFPSRIELWSQLTHDLTLRVVGRAARSGPDDWRAWEYDRLRFTYDFGGTT